MNDTVKIKESETLSDQYYSLQKFTFDRKNSKGEWQSQTREVFERGSSVAILLYNKVKKVILTRQFRLPTYLNGNENGMLLEVCAGMLEQNDTDPLERMIKEVEEETGYRISGAKKVCQAYLSPGAVTELVHLYIAEYAEDMKVSEGGGLESEQEDIEVLEMDFDKAYDMIASGEIRDAKTIMLLQYAKIHGLT